ncbi:MAG: restriction endonuclease subunit M/S, partial [Candidatus Nealsonbacteria bacterium]
ISSFNHIQNKNKKDGRINLTADERTRLINNFSGYDISPDMVRLSLVNMYLHKFPVPKIYEYDTLASEEKWNEFYDIILANPPFMSPKGGIKPHKRFSIQAKRSEVLFVDYIAEHLNPNGRGGVIVPEGIIFQSGNAYKKLRKMLIENSLYAVVSLPAGVFNPYSGVKTSILFLNKNLAKKTDKILFVKVNHDGFDLGAQRRKIKENDLPLTLEIIKKYKQSIIEDKEIEFNRSEEKLAHVVKKEKIAESGDYNLSGDRYKEAVVYNGKWDFVELGELCDFKNGLWKGKKEPLKKISILRNTNFTKTGVLDYSNVAVHPIEISQLKTRTLEYGDIILEKSGGGPTQPVGRVALFCKKDGQIYSYSNFTARIRVINESKINPIYLWRCLHYLHQQGITKNCQNRTSGIRNLDLNAYKKIRIPFPPLEVQEQIVAELDSYQKIIDGAKQVVENYKPTFKIDPEWEIVKLCEVMLVNKSTVNPKKYGKNKFVYIDISSVENGTGAVSFTNKIEGNKLPSRARRIVKKGDILLSTVRPNLKAFCFLEEVPDNAVASTGFAVLSATTKVEPKFVYFQLFSDYLQEQMINRMGKGSYPSINQKDVQELKIFYPPLDIQQKIVLQINNERKIINANKELITIFEKKIKDKIADVWGEQ